MDEKNSAPLLLSAPKIGQIEGMVWQAFYNDYRGREEQVDKNMLKLQLTDYFYHVYFAGVGFKQVEEMRTQLIIKINEVVGKIPNQDLVDEVRDFLLAFINEVADLRLVISKP